MRVMIYRDVDEHEDVVVLYLNARRLFGVERGTDKVLRRLRYALYGAEFVRRRTHEIYPRAGLYPVRRQLNEL